MPAGDGMYFLHTTVYICLCSIQEGIAKYVAMNLANIHRNLLLNCRVEEVEEKLVQSFL